MINSVLKAWQSLPPAQARWTARLLSLAMGLAVALILHYLLYRIGLPSKPFIYMAF